MVTKPCPFGGPDHEYPDDWQFSESGDPRVDPRYYPAHYQYIDDEYGFSFMSGQFQCDDEALDYFTQVRETDPRVKFIAVKRAGEKKFQLMPWVYVAETDTVHPYEGQEK